MSLPLNVGRNKFNGHGALEDAWLELATSMNHTAHRGLTVNGGHQREFVLQAVAFEELVDLNGGQGALERLAVEFGLLDFRNRLFPLNADLGTAEVTAAATAGDHIGDTSALLGEGPSVNGGTEEHLAELDHLHETDTHDGGLGIVAPSHAVDPAGSKGNDVFEGTAQGHTGHIAHHANVEVRTVEEHLQGAVINGKILRGQRLQLHLGQFARGVLVLEVDDIVG